MRFVCSSGVLMFIQELYELLVWETLVGHTKTPAQRNDSQLTTHVLVHGVISRARVTHAMQAFEYRPAQAPNLCMQAQQ